MVIEPLTYSTYEAAEALGVSERQVRHLIQRREIPVVHLGACVRIPKSALATWLDEQALAAVKEQAVAEFLTGGTEPNVIGLGSRRHPRTKRDPIAGTIRPQERKNS